MCARFVEPDSGIASIDLVCCGIVDRQMAVLTRPGRAGGFALPWTAFDASCSLDGAAAHFAREQLGRRLDWMEQLGTFADGRRHPSDAPLSVSYVAAVPGGAILPTDLHWTPITASHLLPPRQQGMVEATTAALATRLDFAPIAFRFLPPKFTLSELQDVYELLLGCSVHKASFRRALKGAHLVEATEEWRAEGRGRPAQLFRYWPGRRPSLRRGVRFELLG